MTHMGPDDVPESLTAGRAVVPRIPKHHVGLEIADLPRDAERFAIGLEDDRKLQRSKLIAGVLSELALIGMLITSLQEPGRAAPAVLAIVVLGLGVTMGFHVAHYRIDGKPRSHS